MGPLWHERHHARLSRLGRGAGLLEMVRSTGSSSSTGCRPRWFSAMALRMTCRPSGSVWTGSLSARCGARWRSPAAPSRQASRLRSLAEVIELLGAGGQTGVIDGTKNRVRRLTARGRVTTPPHRRLQEEPSRVARGTAGLLPRQPSVTNPRIRMPRRITANRARVVRLSRKKIFGGRPCATP